MKISVIIPAYNEEKYIAHTLRAILDQSHPDFEVIVVDNASTDSTVEIARSFPVKVVSETRKGTMFACERGRCEATGDIIVRMDADCLPDKDWLSQGHTHFSDTRIAAVTGPYEYEDSDALFRSSSLFFQKNVYSTINSLLQSLKKGAVMIGGNSFMRASALQAAGGFNTLLVFYGDDTDTAVRMSRQGKVVFDRSLVMKTSARRFASEGRFKLATKYVFHFFKIIFSAPPKKSD
jgi:glycosyltransferase involved in cell wall biosynthesis